MRINLNSKTQDTADVGQAATTGSRVAGNSNGALLPADTAVLSPEQARVQSLAAEVNSLPDVRQEKVAALGLAIQQGNYEVSPEQTAEALLGQMEIRFAA